MTKIIRKNILFIVACIITFCVTYALILPAITMTKDSMDGENQEYVQAIEGTCETFQITVQFQGMDANAFHNFVVSSQPNGGYYLEISHDEKVVKQLYLQNAQGSVESGKFTWTIDDLPTKDLEGNPIAYSVKEKNYLQTPDVSTISYAAFTNSEQEIQKIQVTNSVDNNTATLEETLTFSAEDKLEIRNYYNESESNPLKASVNLALTLEGWDFTPTKDELQDMKFTITPENENGTSQELDIQNAEQSGNTFTWTGIELDVENADFTKIPYVIKETGYVWSNSVTMGAEMTVECTNQKTEEISVQQDAEQHVFTFSSITFCTDESDTIQTKMIQTKKPPGICEEFQITVQFQGMDDQAFSSFIVSSVTKNGYYLEISRADTGKSVKTLYLQNTEELKQSGTITWKISDLETKDSEGNAILYIVKEVNYWQSPSVKTSISALLNTQVIKAVKVEDKNEVRLESPITFQQGDVLNIFNQYNIQCGDLKIQKTFDGLLADDLEAIVSNSNSKNETGYYISMQETVSKASTEESVGTETTKLYLDQATRSGDGKTFTWEVKEKKLADANGTPVQYIIAEHQYQPNNYTLNYRRINVVASIAGREDSAIKVTQDEQQTSATLENTYFSTSKEETLKITNQYYRIKRIGKIRIRTHLDGLTDKDIQSLKDANKFYIEIKEKTSARANTTPIQLHLSDATSVSSDHTTFTWDVNDLPILDSQNQPISYQITQHNYPVNNYAETIVSANITRTDSTISDIGTTPNTENGVAELDDLSFNSDLDTTVDTIDISNSYTNDFSMVCYDKNGKPVENATVTLKNSVTGEVIASGVTAGAGAGVAAGTITFAGIILKGGTVAILTVAGTTIAIAVTSGMLYNYYKNKTNVIMEEPRKPEPTKPDDPEHKPDKEEMKYITLTLKKEWKRSNDKAPEGAKVKFVVYKSENGSTDTTKVTEVTMDGKVDNLEVRPWKVELKNLEGGIVKNKQVIKEYTYYVKEEPLDGYQTTYKGLTGTEMPLIPIQAGGKTIQAVWACTGTDGQVTAINSEVYELPKTGGSGTWTYTAGGALLMMASLLYGYIRGKKRERRT